ELCDDETELRDREEQIDQIQREFLPFAEREQTGDDLFAADIQNGSLSEICDHEHQWEQEREQSRHGDRLIHRTIGGSTELRLLFLFTRKGLDHFHPGKIFLQDRIERGKFFLDFLKQRLTDGAKEHKQHERHRQDRHRRPCERGVGAEQNNDSTGKQDHCANELQ